MYKDDGVALLILFQFNLISCEKKKFDLGLTETKLSHFYRIFKSGGANSLYRPLNTSIVITHLTVLNEIHDHIIFHYHFYTLASS